ncbi:tRNA ligase class I, partial [Ancylostoma ceylanicum]
MEYMYNTYPDRFIGIAVHNGDPMTVSEYDNGANFGGYPSANIDRSILDGDFSSANYRLGVIIIEDGVKGTSSGYNQANAYAGGGYGPMGGYESLPSTVPAAQMVYDHVGRALLGGYNGQAGSVPTEIYDGMPVSYTFNYTVPAAYNIDNMYAVGVIIDNTTGEIINANKSPLKTLSLGSVESVEMNVFPNPATDKINVSFEAKGEYREYKGLNLPNVAKSVLEKWNTEKVFEQSISSREGQKPYVFFEGPPSANGLPGIHHVMARSIKDIFCRYQTLKGFQVKRKAGWDTHGLPVELGVEKELGITKEDIGTKISVEDYNIACKNAVMRYTDIWNNLTKEMGYWVDMDHPYITYESKYMESVWWLLGELYKKNLLYKGYTIQPYSPKAGTGLSSHELNQPGCYRDVTDTTVVAQFKVKAEDTQPVFQKFGVPASNEADVHFLAWTTTPWTLPSNTALTVGPKIEYVLVKTFNQYTFREIY